MAKNLPEINPQSFNIQLTSMFYDNKGELVANRYYTENRVWTEFANMPQNYVNAVVSSPFPWFLPGSEHGSKTSKGNPFEHG